MLAGVAQELHQPDVAQPVGVVEESGRVGSFERQEPRELSADALGVAVDLRELHDRPFGALSARIADHAGAAAHQGDGGMPVPLQPGQPHHRDQVADVQRIGRGIEADVGGDGTLAQSLGEAGGGVLDEATGVEQLEKIGHRRKSYPLERCLATG